MLQGVHETVEIGVTLSGIWDEDAVAGNPFISNLLAGDDNPFTGGFFLAVLRNKIGIRGSVRLACVDRSVRHLLWRVRLSGSLVHCPYNQGSDKYGTCEDGSRYPVIVGVPASITSAVRPIVPSCVSEGWDHK